MLPSDMPPERIVGALLAAIFGAIALMHFYWIVRGVTGGGAALPTRANGQPLFQPSLGTTMMVVIALVAASIVISGRTGLFHSNTLLTSLWRLGALVLGTVLLARAVGDFRYVGLFRRERSTKFAVADTRYFTALCIAIAGAVCFVASR